MTKLALESVSTEYDIYRDRVLSIEIYVPIENSEDDWELYCDGEVSNVTRRVWMTPYEWERKKALLKIRGIPVRNAAGKEVGLNS